MDNNNTITADEPSVEFRSLDKILAEGWERSRTVTAKTLEDALESLEERFQCRVGELTDELYGLHSKIDLLVRACAIPGQRLIQLPPGVSVPTDQASLDKEVLLGALSEIEAFLAANQCLDPWDDSGAESNKKEGSFFGGPLTPDSLLAHWKALKKSHWTLWESHVKGKERSLEKIEKAAEAEVQVQFERQCREDAKTPPLTWLGKAGLLVFCAALFFVLVSVGLPAWFLFMIVVVYWVGAEIDAIRAPRH